jgi:LCP family protein required for cell wall assembly
METGADGGNDRDGGKRSGGKKRRPRWRYAFYALGLLLAVELGVLAASLIRANLFGFVQNLPIATKPGNSAVPTLPPGLEPGSGADTGDQSGDVGPPESTSPLYRQDAIDPNVLNVLVLGLDTTTPGGNGRSDINMIVSIDKKKNTIKLVSILRDTLVPIEGHDWNRINSAYAFGGPGLSINTVNDAFLLDIQRYVKLDFFAIEDIVDAMGGVDVTLTEAEVSYLRAHGHSVSKGAGSKHLDGDAALAYARIRKIDSDFQRTQRQRNVMTALLAKARSMGIAQAVSLMTKLLPQVKTNIGTSDAVALVKQVLNMGNGELRQMTVPVAGSYDNKKYKGMDILSVDFKKNADAIREFLYGG